MHFSSEQDQPAYIEQRSKVDKLTEGANGELKHMHSGVQIKAEVDVQPVHCAHQVLLSIHHLYAKPPLVLLSLVTLTTATTILNMVRE